MAVGSTVKFCALANVKLASATATRLRRSMVKMRKNGDKAGNRERMRGCLLEKQDGEEQ
jgi:hypothetical protein